MVHCIVYYFVVIWIKQTTGDPSLFVLAQDTSLIYLLIYVDDMVLTENNTLLMALITEFLGTQFKIKDLGSLSFFLGIKLLNLM